MTEKMKYDDTNQSSWVIYTEQKYKCNNFFCFLFNSSMYKRGLDLSIIVHKFKCQLVRTSPLPS